MAKFEIHGDFGLGIAVGISLTLILAGILGIAALHRTDKYGLGHWKLNLDTPLKSMWMNVGYWKNAQGEPIHRFEEACAALLHQILNLSGILDQDPKLQEQRGTIGVLDLGFGCGDQTWELARLTRNAGWSGFQYVGLTLNEAQVQASLRKIYRETANADSDIKAESFALFCANAARPETWNARVKEAVDSLANGEFEERWLLALDCLYHFSPSRKPILKYAASSLDANFMAFDLLLSDTATLRDTLLIRAVGVMMGCPVGTFLTESQYRDVLTSCGYYGESIAIREITDDVFPGLVKFLDNQDRALGEYGISLGGFKLAQRLFDWFGRSKVVRAVVVVAKTKGEQS